MKTIEQVKQEERELELKKEAERVKEEAKLSSYTKLGMKLDAFTNNIDKALVTHFKTIEQLESKKEALLKDKENDLITLTVLNEKLRELEIDEKMENDAMSDEIKRDIERLNEEYKEFTQPKGEEINDNDLKLLDSGIKFTNEQFQRLVNKHNQGSNYTMLTILNQYMKENGLRAFIKKSVSDEAFKILEQQIQSAIINDGHSRLEFSTTKYRDAKLNQFKELF